MPTQPTDPYGGHAVGNTELRLIHQFRLRAPAPCAGLQSCQLPAHAGDARRDRDMVADLVARASDQDRRTARWAFVHKHFAEGNLEAALAEFAKARRPQYWWSYLWNIAL